MKISMTQSEGANAIIMSGAGICFICGWNDRCAESETAPGHIPGKGEGLGNNFCKPRGSMRQQI